MSRSTTSSSASANYLSTPKSNNKRSSSSGSGHSTPPSISTTSRPSFPTTSLRTSPAKSSHPSGSVSEHSVKTARSSLLNVLSRPRITSQVSNTTVSAEGPLLTPEDEFSDQSTISSYASSSSSSGSFTGASSSNSSSSEELAKMYKDYLEKPFVNIKQVIKHSEFGHDNNPNWRWTSQYNPNEPIHTGGEETPSYFVLISTYMR
jgi:serine palmitoyltransferase